MADRAGINKILILGDNRLSQSIIKALKDADYDLHQAGSSTETSPLADLTYHTTDLNPDSLSPLLRTIQPNLVINTTTSSLQPQISIIQTCLSCNIPRYIPNEFSHDTQNPAISTRLPTAATKSSILAELEKSKSTMSYVGIATGYPLDYGLQGGNIGFDLKWQSATILSKTGKEKFAVCSEDFRGEVVKAVLDDWQKFENRYIYACGTITSANEILNILGEGWEVGKNEVQDAIGEAERRIKRGFPDAGMVLMERTILYDESLNAVRPFIDQDSKPKLGVAGEKVDDIITHARHQFNHHGPGGCDCSS